MGSHIQLEMASISKLTKLVSSQEKSMVILSYNYNVMYEMVLRVIFRLRQAVVPGGLQVALSPRLHIEMVF